MTNEMTMEDGKSSNNGMMDSVKFTKAGDEVDISQPTTKLIGLTKEELEKYRNDPFWKTIRYTLFIAFWLVWAAMFIGAILIVVLSPKCAAKVEQKWHENAVVYQIFTPTFRDAVGDGVGDFKGIQEKLNDLRKIGISAIWPTPIVVTDKDTFAPEEVVEISTTDSRFGSEDDLRSLIVETHNSGMKFIADLPLTVSASNKWLPKNGTVEVTKRVFLLDVTNHEVLNKLVDAAIKWLQMGIDGLYLTDYGLTGRLPNQPLQMDELIRRIRIAIKENAIPQKDVLIFTSVSGVRQSTNQTENYYVQSLTEPSSSTGGPSLLDRVTMNIQQGIKATEGMTKPIWQVGNLIGGPRVDQQLLNSSNPKDSALKAHPRETSALLSLIQLFLPGPVSVLYGEELALPSGEPVANSQKLPQLIYQQWDPSENFAGFSSLNVTSPADLFFLSPNNSQGITFKEQLGKDNTPLRAFEKLAELRAGDLVFHQGNVSHQYSDGIELIGRYLQPTEIAYLLAVNWNNTPKQVPMDPTKLARILGGKQIDGSADVRVVSEGFTSLQARNNVNVLKQPLRLEPFTAIVLSFHR